MVYLKAKLLLTDKINNNNDTIKLVHSPKIHDFCLPESPALNALLILLLIVYMNATNNKLIK